MIRGLINGERSSTWGAGWDVWLDSMLGTLGRPLKSDIVH